MESKPKTNRLAVTSLFLLIVPFILAIVDQILSAMYPESTLLHQETYSLYSSYSEVNLAISTICWILVPITGFLAIISLVQISRSEGEQRGKWFAWVAVLATYPIRQVSWELKLRR